MTISVFLIHDLYPRDTDAAGFDHGLPTIVADVTGAFLLIGLWTPIAGAITVGIELWIAFSSPGKFWMSLLASGIASSLTLLGPGAWSLDAIAYGRKRISISGR